MTNNNDHYSELILRLKKKNQKIVFNKNYRTKPVPNHRWGGSQLNTT